MRTTSRSTLLQRLGWTWLQVEAAGLAAMAILFLLGVLLSILFN